jgi:hypothetical protein
VALVGRPGAEGGCRHGLVEVAREHAAPADPAGHGEGAPAGRRAPPAPHRPDPGAAALVDRHRDAGLVAAELSPRVTPSPRACAAGAASRSPPPSGSGCPRGSRGPRGRRRAPRTRAAP